MAQPSITIEPPPGFGRRCAIEWCVEHLIRALDRLDEAEGLASDGAAEKIAIPSFAHCDFEGCSDACLDRSDPTDDLPILSAPPRPVLLTIILGGLT